MNIKYKLLSIFLTLIKIIDKNNNIVEILKVIINLSFNFKSELYLNTFLIINLNKLTITSRAKDKTEKIFRISTFCSV